jgi:DNA-binding transcriptional MerR regulator
MLKIGDLANFCRVSIKALRHYNRIGLFQPQYIDSATGYRYYSEDQIKELVFILDLKDIGFSLKEIISFQEKVTDTKSLLNMLSKKRIEAEDNIRFEKLRIENINSISQKIQAELGVKKLKGNGNTQFDTKIARMVTLDCGTSEARHLIEEAIWV